MKNTLLTVLGFSMFLIGFLALVLSIVNLDLQILAFLKSFNPSLAFLIKILLLFVGIALFYVGRTADQEEEAI